MADYFKESKDNPQPYIIDYQRLYIGKGSSLCHDAVLMCFPYYERHHIQVHTRSIPISGE